MARRGADLARSRERFLSDEQAAPAAGVRAEIAASWERSRRAGLDASRFEVPWVGDAERDDADGDLVALARPVLDDLAERIAGSAVAVVLCDADGLLVDRRVGEDGLRRHLDAISLAPGFSYAEQFAGTNGVGTALCDGIPSLVVGAEHYTDRLQAFACAGAPVRRPDGTLAGVLDVTCLRDQAGDLLRVLAHQAARDIAERLRERSGVGPRSVMAAFRAACARYTGPVVAVGAPGDDFLLVNAAAREELTATERDVVAARAAERLAVRAPHGSAAPERVVLGEGPAWLLHLPVIDPRAAGAVVAVSRGLVPRGPLAHIEAPGQGARRPLAGLAGSSPAWCGLGAALRSAADTRGPTLVLGEPGTGKTVAVRAAHLERSPTARWVLLDGADGADAAASDAELAATLDGLPDLVGPGAATVVLRHLDALGPRARAALTDLLEELPPTWWLVGLVTGTEQAVGELLAAFDPPVVVEPLRRRPEDIAPLVTALLARLAPTRRARITPEALAALHGARWPGNAHELIAVLRRALVARPAGDIEPDDLPEELGARGTRRRLSPLEAAERDLIVEALVAAGGNRVQAATALGMGRTTLYRRLRAFGLTDVGR